MFDDGALTGFVTVGKSRDVAGSQPSVIPLTVRPESRLIFGPGKTAYEKWSTEPAISGENSEVSLEILADQPGILTSSTVDGRLVLVEVRNWSYRASWTVVRASDGKKETHNRRFVAPGVGETVDLDLLPQDGALPVATTRPRAITATRSSGVVCSEKSMLTSASFRCASANGC